ncbi:MAG: cytidylyltransferase domain-containing protein [Planctomycetota bacterium]
MPPTHGLIIPVRMDSSRLPGKALADVAGRPVLSRLIERLRVAGGRLGPILVATTDRPVDDPLDAWGEAEGIPVIRHASPVDDVAGRFAAVARSHRLQWAARVNGDSPLVDARMLIRGLERAIDHAQPPVDLVSNLVPRRHPYGMAVEWIRTDALGELLPTFSAAEREHVTSGLYATLERSRIAGLDGGDPAWADVRTVVDTAEDLERLRRFVADHGAGWTRASAGDIVAWIAGPSGPAADSRNTPNPSPRSAA